MRAQRNRRASRISGSPFEETVVHHPTSSHWRVRRAPRPALRPTALAAALALAIASPLAAQDAVDQAAVAKIRDEGMNRSRVMEITSYLTDVYGSRLTGAPSTRSAGEWAAKQLSSWGLVDTKLETWGPFGRGWTNERFVAHVVAPRRFPIIGYASAWTPGTNGPVRGEAIHIALESDADFEKYRGKLRGRIALVSPLREVEARFTPLATRQTEQQLAEMAAAAAPGDGGQRQYSPELLSRFRAMQEMARKRDQFLVEEGVLASVSAGRGDGGTVFTNNGGSRDPKSPTPLPQIFFAVEHYGQIVRMLEKNIPVTLELDVQNTFHDGDQISFNLVADIPGTDPSLASELVMLGAHFDSWHAGTGATDNAAGSAVMMEAVRLITAAGLKPKRTIRIALWTGEEQGLLGSRAYVKEHFADRETMALKPDHAKVSAYFNLDNGTGAIRGVYLQGNAAVAPIFRTWMEPFKERMNTLTAGNTGGTDHLSFDAVGLPGFQFIQDPIEYGTRTHHSNMDVYERIQEDDMKHNAVVVATFVYHAAMRAEKLPRKPLPGVVQ